MNGAHPAYVYQRRNRIDSVLKSCLNWQEAVSIGAPDLYEGRRRGCVSDVAAVAFKKITFLQDALIYSLYRHVLHGGIGVDFNFDQAILNQLGDDDFYTHGLAIARLFRAQMATRSGAPHGLSWGRFSYARCPMTYGYPNRRHQRRLAEARESVFVNPAPESPVAVLAERLLLSARSFTDMYYNGLEDEQRDVLLNAIMRDEPEHEALLEIWEATRNYGLPLDKLWVRNVNCVYTANCIEYDEFVAKMGDENCPQMVAAREKVDALEGKEQDYEESWRDVARNWWCCGFVNGIYCWVARKVGGVERKIAIDRNRRQDVLRQDVDELVKKIEGDDTYVNVNEDEIGKCYEQRKEVVRAACEGKEMRRIWRDLDVKYPALYSILFLVATTVTKPKLQDCWSRAVEDE